MSYLIDTNILIYSLKNNDIVNNNFLLHASDLKFISVITYGELMYGAHRSVHKSRSMATTRRIAELFPILDITRSIIESFSELKAELHQKGTPLDDMDLLIAATALHHNCTLVTNNERHFTKIPGIRVENWTKEVS